MDDLTKAVNAYRAKLIEATNESKLPPIIADLVMSEVLTMIKQLEVQDDNTDS